MLTTAALALEDDLAMLRAAEAVGAAPAFRTWTSTAYAVVVGRSVQVEAEVDVACCDAEGIPIVQRPSGGRSVVIGPGTLQYTFSLPLALTPELRTIATTKRYCNRLLLSALPRGHGLVDEASGDLVRGDRKVGGLALRRTRDAVLLHGTLLLTAEIARIGRILKHPAREPLYRRRRSHEEFLANLGPIDPVALEDRVRELWLDRR